MSICPPSFLRAFFLIASLKIITILSLYACLSCEIVEHLNSSHSSGLRVHLRVPIGKSPEGIHYTELPKDVPFSALQSIITNKRKELGYKPNMSKGEIPEILHAHPWYRGTEYTINTPFSGKLVNCEVTPGQQLCKGDLLFIVEAMKMTSYVHTPISGTMCTIRYRTNEILEANTVVMSILPPSSEWDIIPESELEKEKDILLSLFTQDNNDPPSDGSPSNRPTLSMSQHLTLFRYDPSTTTLPMIWASTFPIITRIKLDRSSQNIANLESYTSSASRLINLKLHKQPISKYPIAKNRLMDTSSQKGLHLSTLSNDIGKTKLRLLPNMRFPLIDLRGLLREFSSFLLPDLSKKSVNFSLLSATIVLIYFLYVFNATTLTFVRKERAFSRRTRNLR